MRGLMLTLTLSTSFAVLAIVAVLSIVVFNVSVSVNYIVPLNGLGSSSNPYAYNAQEYIRYLYGVLSQGAFLKCVRLAETGITYLTMFVRFSTVKYVVNNLSVLFPIAIILVNIACTFTLRGLTTKSALQALTAMTRSAIVANALATIALISLSASLPLAFILYASLAPLVGNGIEFLAYTLASIFLFFLTSSLLPLPLFLWFQSEFVFLSIGIAEFIFIVTLPTTSLPQILFPSAGCLASLAYSTSLQIKPLLEPFVWIAIFLVTSWFSVRRCELY